MYKTAMIKKILLIICFFFAYFIMPSYLPLYAQSSSLENNVMDHYLNGNTFYKEGKFKEAQEEYQKAFELMDNFSEETMLTPGRKPQLPVNWETEESKKARSSDPMKQAYEEARDAKKKLEAINIGNSEMEMKDRDLEHLAESLTQKFHQQSWELTRLKELQDQAREAKNKLNAAIAINVALTQKQREMEDAIDELNGKLSQQVKDIEALKLAQEEERSSKKDLDPMISANNKLQQKISSAESEIEILNQKVKQQQDLISSFNRAKEETRSIKYQHDAMVLQNAQMKQRLDELDFNITNLKQQLKGFSGNTVNLKSAQDESSKANDKLDLKKAANEQLEKSLKELENSLMDLEKKFKQELGNEYVPKQSQKKIKDSAPQRNFNLNNEEAPVALDRAVQKSLPVEEPVKLPAPEAIKTEAFPPKGDSLEYVLGEGDELKISVWQNADLDQETIIRPDGKISFSLIGDLPAARLTVSQLDNLITDKLREFIKQPEVTIIIRKMGGQKIIVLGEVTTPGVFAVTGAKTVLEAIGKAGGFTKDAVPSSVIFIRRTRDSSPQAKRLNLSKALTKGDLSQNLEIVSEDVIFVPRKFIADVNYFLEAVLGPISKGLYTAKELQGF